MNPYQILVESIILQAVKDYRDALRGKTVESGMSATETIAECEDFFRSEHYRQFTKVSGEMLIKKLREEYINESRVNSTNIATN